MQTHTHIACPLTSCFLFLSLLHLICLLLTTRPRPHAAGPPSYPPPSSCSLPALSPPSCTQASCDPHAAADMLNIMCRELEAAARWGPGS